MHPAGFAINCGWHPDADHVWPPTTDGQLWELLSRLGQRSWAISAPFLFTQHYSGRGHCVVDLVKMDSYWISHWSRQP